MAALQEIWRSAGPASRIGVVGGVVVIVALSVAALFWVYAEKKEVLFTGLDPQDATGIAGELDRMGVSYELGQDGQSIYVPQGTVHDARLRLMESGVPLNGGVGFELFDNADFGMTEFAQKINYQRALEGELTRTITSLKEVKYARVHLVMPEGSLFKQDKTPPSASVTLFMRDGAVLDEGRIVGIQRMVAAAVPGLEIADVTIADQNGVTLSRVAPLDSGIEAVSEHLKKKQEVEAYLQKKVMDVLERTFGGEPVIVSVDVTLNLDQTKTTREAVLPPADSKQGVLHRRETRSSNGADASHKGTKVTTEVEYRLGRQVDQIVSGPGSIERISVGVLVPAAMDEQRLAQLRELVSMSVGLDKTRGDAIALFPVSAQEWQRAAVQQTSGIAPASAAAGAGHTQSAVQEQSAGLGDGGMQDNTSPEVKPASVWARLAGVDQEPFLLAILALVLVFGAVALILKSVFGRSTPASGRRLTTQEREQLLGQLKDWLNGGEVVAQGDVKT